MVSISLYNAGAKLAVVPKFKIVLKVQLFRSSYIYFSKVLWFSHLLLDLFLDVVFVFCCCITDYTLTPWRGGEEHLSGWKQQLTLVYSLCSSGIWEELSWIILTRAHAVALYYGSQHCSHWKLDQAWRIRFPVALMWLPGQSWLAVGRRPQFLSTWVSPWCYRYSSLPCDGWFPPAERMHPKRAGQKPQSLLWVASEVTLQPSLVMVTGVSPVPRGVALPKGLNARRQESPFRDAPTDAA